MPSFLALRGRVTILNNSLIGGGLIGVLRTGFGSLRQGRGRLCLMVVGKSITNGAFLNGGVPDDRLCSLGDVVKAGKMLGFRLFSNLNCLFSSLNLSGFESSIFESHSLLVGVEFALGMRLDTVFIFLLRSRLGLLNVFNGDDFVLVFNLGMGILDSLGFFYVLLGLLECLFLGCVFDLSLSLFGNRGFHNVFDFRLGFEFSFILRVLINLGVQLSNGCGFDLGLIRRFLLKIFLWLPSSEVWEPVGQLGRCRVGKHLRGNNSSSRRYSGSLGHSLGGCRFERLFSPRSGFSGAGSRGSTVRNWALGHSPPSFGTNIRNSRRCLLWGSGWSTLFYRLAR